MSDAKKNWSARSMTSRERRAELVFLAAGALTGLIGLDRSFATTTDDAELAIKYAHMIQAQLDREPNEGPEL